MSKKRILLLILLGIVLVGYLGYRYAYQSHRDVQTEEASFTVNATEIIAEFSTDADAASKKYLNKIVDISGEITDKDGNILTIDNSIFAQFAEEPVNTQGSITLKGRCIGYDDLLEEIKFDQCYPIQ